MPQTHSPYRLGADRGFFFGIYLVVMFAASLVSNNVPLARLLSFVMFLAVPFLIYKLLRRTFVSEGGTSTLSSLWMQGIVIFACGSLLLGFAMAIYMRFIHPTFLVEQIELLIKAYSGSGWPTGEEIATVFRRMLDAGAVPSAIDIAIETIWLSIFTGSLLSLVVALIARAIPITKSVTTTRN